MRGVVLAAGLGKRMRPLTLDRPKHLLPIAGKALIWRVVEAVIAAGISEVGVVVGYRAEAVAEALRGMHGAEISFIKQEEQLGTAHALLAAAEYIDGEDRFAVVYGDVTVKAEELKALIRETGREYDGGLIGIETGEAARFGVIEEKGGLLLRLREKPERFSGRALINSGIYILPREVLTHARRLAPSPRGEYELTDALNLLVGSGGKLLVKKSDAGWWLDVGRPRDLLKANLTYLEGWRMGPRSLGEASRLSGSYIGEARVGSDAEITSSVVLDKTRVGDGTHIENSLVLEGVDIGPGCKLSYCIIGENAKIGAGSLLMGSEEAPLVIGHGEAVPPWSRATSSGSEDGPVI